jgi:D-aminoacyl-tRNA deacylase
MAQRLIDTYDFRMTAEDRGNSYYQRGEISLIQTEEELLYFKEPNGYSADAYIFLSRHQSESQIPTLTAHFPGNFGDAEYGGRSRELGITYPSLHREFLKRLRRLQDRAPDYMIVTEPMHHGPTDYKKPILFVEIGSSEKRWNDPVAVETVCEALIETVENLAPAEKIAVGFGGTHYSNKFTRLITETRHALGAIAPKYALEYLDRFMMSQMIHKSTEEVTQAVIDWKGVKERGRIVALTEGSGLEIVKV